jgi:hypothetical protein
MDTFVVVRAVTLNVADPAQVTVASAEIPLTVIVYALPAGMPPTRKLIVVLFETLTVPVCIIVAAPLGPVTVHVTELTVWPPGNVSCAPTVPVFSLGETPGPLEVVLVGEDSLDEQPA